MEPFIIILCIMFWVLLALMCFCLCAICYIKLTYLKWDKDEREFNRFINIHKTLNSEYSENESGKHGK